MPTTSPQAYWLQRKVNSKKKGFPKISEKMKNLTDFVQTF